MSKSTVPTIQLKEGLTVPRVLTGLWQVADMEREAKLGAFDAQVADMRSYAEAGFSTFDMADHYGSAEDITGAYLQKYGAETPIQAMTKWVPKPGKSPKTWFVMQ